MNRSEFLNMIGDSSHLNRQMVGEVNELLTIFPYFQSAHLLLLKGLHSIADIKFENQLRNSAIHIADREVLYYLLNTPQKSDKPEPEEVKIVPSADTTVQVTEMIPEKMAPGVDVPEAVPVTEHEENSPDVPGEPVNAKMTPEIIVSEAVTMDEVEDDHHQINIEPSEPFSDPDDLLELDQEENEDTIAETEAEPQEEIRQSSGWKLQSELIDKFIIANPRIEPNRDKTPLPAEEVNKHIQEEGVFVTETLARIYVNQGYYSKAIDIYEKLSLKFPEKSSYFASQIEKVKEHLKN